MRSLKLGADLYVDEQVRQWEFNEAPMGGVP